VAVFLGLLAIIASAVAAARAVDGSDNQGTLVLVSAAGAMGLAGLLVAAFNSGSLPRRQFAIAFYVTAGGLIAAGLAAWMLAGAARSHD